MNVSLRQGFDSVLRRCEKLKKKVLMTNKTYFLMRAIKFNRNRKSSSKEPLSKIFNSIATKLTPTGGKIFPANI
jgi:hypothetical protein